MQIFFAVLLFICGLFFTVRGGDNFVTAAGRISEIFAVPKFVIGATVVSLATTLPELLVSLLAAQDGKIDMAVGNAVGSVTANTGLILALSFLFIPPSPRQKNGRFKYALLLLCVLTLFVFSLSGRLLPAGSALLLFLFSLFIFENVRSAKGGRESTVLQDGESLALSLFRFLLGSAGIIIGAKLLVDNASALARILGVGEAVIATTVLAIGTSLPELTTTLCAIRKKESALSIGNILGANIIDISIILPACSLLSGKPLPISRRGLTLDMTACFIIICIATATPLLRGRPKKAQGAVLLGAYILYIIFTVISV